MPTTPKETPAFAPAIERFLSVVDAIKTAIAADPARKIYIWGAGDLGVAVANGFYLLGIPYAGFVSGTPVADGFLYTDVFYPDILPDTDAFFVVASSLTKEIVPQIQELNPEALEGRDYVIVPVPASGNIVSNRYVNSRTHYCAKHPLSYSDEKKHPQWPMLWQKFIKDNKRSGPGDMVRLWSFILNIKQILAEGVRGDFAEVGVWRGNTAAVLAELSKDTGREVFLFDTFEGFDKRDIVDEDANKPADLFSDAANCFGGTSIELVKETVGKEHNHCHYIKGYFPQSITPEVERRAYAVVSLDCDLYAPTKAALEFFYSRMPAGGLFLLHDYVPTYWKCGKAIDEFCKQSGERVIIMADICGSALIRKTKPI